MNSSARGRIAEVIRAVEVQSANYHYIEERGGGEDAANIEAATDRIIEIFATYYGHFNDGCSCCKNSDLFTSLGFTVDEWEELSGGWEAVDPAFGADDDG